MLEAMWHVLLSFAPWMLLGMALAGGLHVMLPRRFVRRHLGGRWGVVKAVALGVPLPLCSCGVIPTGLGLKKDGASNGAAVGFLISTPQTGVDSILVSAAFLGWPFALFKVVSAALTGVVGGLLTDAVGGAADIEGPAEPAESAVAGRGLREAVDHALMILRTIWPWIAFGVLVSAAIEVFVPPGLLGALAGYGTVVPILGALAVSLPLYVCTTASVPIAAALVAGGMTPGAALVFLMAGPATNVATVGALVRALGRRALGVYLMTIVAGSMAAAVFFDFLLEAVPSAVPHVHHDHGWWAVACGVALLGLMAWFLGEDLRRLSARWLGSRRDQPVIEVGVAGMKCGGCASKLERALLDEDGVLAVIVTLDPGKAVVHGSIESGRIHRVVEHLGFEVVEV